ncbi:MAG: hypothetical protein ACOH19_15200 [Rhodoglobus sp.]
MTFLTTPPPSLAEGMPIGEVPVIQQSFADSREVEVALSIYQSVFVTAPTEGRITQFSCQPGEEVVSGSTWISVDGAPILTLATSVPLWRDLQLGDAGPDVLSLQNELIRLGKPLAADGVLGNESMIAMQDLFDSLGDSLNESSKTISLARLMWIPSSTATVASCEVSVGMSSSPGQSIASFESTLKAAQIKVMPEDMLPGDRVLEVGGLSLPVGELGQVTDPTALASLSTTPEYREATQQEGPMTLRSTISLRNPAAIFVLPPASIYEIEGDQGCVAHGSETFAVQIVGSQLGQSFVTFESGQAPDMVELNPKSTPAC